MISNATSSQIRHSYMAQAYAWFRPCSTATTAARRIRRERGQSTMKRTPRILVIVRDDLQSRALEIRVFEKSEHGLHGPGGKCRRAFLLEIPYSYFEVFQPSCKNPVKMVEIRVCLLAKTKTQDHEIYPSKKETIVCLSQKRGWYHCEWIKEENDTTESKDQRERNGETETCV